MSGYPNPNYASMPQYPSDAGTSCDNPKPAWYWEGGTFCNDVTINKNLNVGGAAILGSLEILDVSVSVDGVSYTQQLFQNPYDGLFYYVLANALPKDFVPPPVPK